MNCGSAISGQIEMGMARQAAMMLSISAYTSFPQIAKANAS